jgi:crotonobetainyl-CoA:carnitine CoA-transferase CaiB-like acyl-CoA transferase
MGEALSRPVHLMSRLGTFLAGVKVLDLSQYIPGPMASLFLADMGAEVLKIEPPGGDPMRELGPRDGAGEPVFYCALNAGKAVHRANLKDPGARAEVIRLAAEADVLIEGFRPGTMARLGLDYDTLRPLNPRLVYCSISGYGATGELAQKAAHDANYLATSGMLDRNGKDAPLFFDPPVTDTSGALFAALTIVGALHGRERDGQGCHIDLGLADVAHPLQLMQVAGWGATGVSPGRASYYLNGGAAFYRTYATADGRHVVLGAVEPKFWRNFCEAAGRPEWIARQSEPMPQDRLAADVAALFAAMALGEAVARFDAVDCCFSPVLDLGEALNQPQLRERGLVRQGSAAGDLQSLFPALVDGAAPTLRAPVRHVELTPGARAPFRNQYAKR